MALLEIYKKDQGKLVRWGTVGGIALLLGIGMYWIAKGVVNVLGDWHITSTFTIHALYLQTFWVVLFGLIGAVLALWLVNRPKSADFMIMTESEMRKVNWPGWHEVWVSTKVVIVLTLFFAAMLFVVDWLFIRFFEAVKVLAPTT